MSGLKVYGVPLSRAFRALWCANELNLDYEHMPLHFADGSTKKPEYLSVNPNGKLPAIEDGELKLWESMAITCYLAKKHGSGLWPKTLEDEAKVLQWSFWVVSELEKPVLSYLLHTAFLPEAKRNPDIAREALGQVQAPLKVLDEALKGTGYLIGDNFTVADLNVAAVLSWAKASKLDLSAFPQVAQWLDRSLSRPAAVRAQKAA
jgi:glutathione S-transferase